MSLRVKDVSFHYPQDGTGLSPVSFAVAPGELLLGTGASGCGKSTLTRILTGLIPHLYRGDLQGEVEVDGAASRARALHELTERVGLVFQNPMDQMLAPTVEDEILFGLENLGLSRMEMGERLQAALDRFNLTPMRKRSPQTLSGGEKQKLALAAITARNPRYLVLDEPLSMLDSTATMDFLAYLKGVQGQDRSVLLFEHRKGWLNRLQPTREIHLPGKGLPAGNMKDIPPLQSGSPFQLQVRDLSVRVGGRSILDRCSFSAEAGEILAVVGRNGVGKTTLLRALAGLQSHQGRIYVRGDTSQVRPDMRLVFENPNLQIFNPTVKEEILYRMSPPDMNLYQWLLDALRLGQYQDVPPLLLSEGEKKRVALATILLQKPAHGLLLDEPSLGQDRAHKKMLVQILKALKGAGKLVIFASHDLTLTYQADRILLLGESGVLAEGPPQELYQDESPWLKAGLRLPQWARGQKLERWSI